MFPISFGVELEFVLAYLDDKKQKAPSNTETRLLHFPQAPGVSIDDRERTMLTIQYHIVNLLHSSSFPVNMTPIKEARRQLMHTWEVSDDISIETPKKGENGFVEGYRYLGIEVKTPALELYEDSFTAVQKFGYRPLPSAVVAQFVNAKDMRHLLHLAQFRIGKMMSYNFDGINRAEFGSRPKEGEKEQGRGVTIEFRQHAGTLDGQAICMWVRTLAGFVKFIEEVSPESFVDFIGTIMEAELWEKEHDGKDAEREAKYGPIPADGPFTIIDLLQHIGLEKEAEYYKDKWVIHEG